MTAMDAEATTRYLKDTGAAADPQWAIEGGSVLDEAYLASLGQGDIVYSWGML